MESKHSIYDLAQMQSLSLDMKIRMTEQRIKEWYEHFDGQVYVSFSGGKDSTVLKHIIDSMYDDVPALFVNTGLEYPELQRFVSDIKAGKYDCFNPDVEIVRPEKRFDEVIKECGYPIITKRVSQVIYYARKNIAEGKENTYRVKALKGEIYKDGKKSWFNCEKWGKLLDAPFLIHSDCCKIMKKNPAKMYGKNTGRKPIVGTMANESLSRKTSWMVNGCNVFTSQRERSQPMSFWTENDVLEYIRRFKVPYASVYGDIVETGKSIERITGEVPELDTTGCKRTGCMFCMFGCHLEKAGEGRFEKMKETHPKQYEYCMKPVEEGGLGLKDVIDWTNEHCGTKILY